MIYHNITGSGTSFTIPTDGLTADHTFLFHQGQWCYRVTSSPGINEYTLSTGITPANLVLGFSKDSGDDLYCWTESVSTRVLTPATINGAQNGSNRNYIIVEAVPSGTEPIVIHCGKTLNPTGTGIGHYARTGSGFTLDAAHPAPLADDPFFILVASTNTTTDTFHLLTLTQPGTLNPAYVDAGLLGDGSYLQYVLAHSNARVFVSVATVPAFGEVRHYPIDGYVQWPMILNLTTDKLRAWEIGAVVASTLAFDTWLVDNLPKVLYAQLELVKSGGTKTLKLASQAVQTFESSAWIDWLPFLRGGLTIRKAIPEQFSGFAVASYGEIALTNPVDPVTGTRELDSDFGVGAASYTTFGQRLQLWLGGLPDHLAADNRQLLLDGKMESPEREWSTVSVPIRDGAWQLKRKTVHLVIDTATNYTSAPAESDGKTIPLHLGKVFNYAPTLVDPGSLLYSVGKASNVLAVYDNGYSVSFLAGFNGPAGVIDFQLFVQPVGTVTCDVVGAIVGGSGPDPTYLADILFDLAVAAGLAVNSERSQAFADAFPYEVGLVVAEPTSYEEIMETLLSGMLGFYQVLPDNTYRLGVVEAPAGKGSVAKFDEIDVVGTDWRLRERPPTYATKIAYNNNETVMSNGVADAVSLARKEFLKQSSQTVPYKDAATLSTYADATDEGVIQTRLVHKANALVLATRRINFLKARRQILELRVPLTAYAIELSEVIRLDMPSRLVLTNSQWLVIKKEWRLLGDAPSSILLEVLQ